MLATSWKATGLVQPVWNRLDVPKDKRGELARLTGIPATNLSAMNTGNMPMTMEMAERIAAAIEGLSVLELGAPLELADQRGQTLLDRLQEVEDLVAEGFARLAEGIARVERRLGSGAGEGSGS